MLRHVIVLALCAATLAGPAACGAGDWRGEGKVALPAAFPPDVPLPANAVLRTSQNLGEKGLNLVFETTEGVAAAAKAQMGSLVAAGWSLAAEAPLEGRVFASFHKGERFVAIGVSRSESGGGTILSLACSPAPGADAGGAGE